MVLRIWWCKTFKCQGYTLGQALFNQIIICAIFISVNAIQKLLLHELILIIHGYDQRVSKMDLRLPGL